MRIEICGGLGTGKTTLASIANSTEITVVNENFRSNPFWEAFYTDPGKFQFETEITFLLQHYHQIKTASSSSFICDFSLLQDLAFAKLGLKDNKYRIFKSVYEECINEIGPPDYIIHLECSVQHQLDRIKARGRKEEQTINHLFLTGLNNLIKNEVATVSSDKVVKIDSGEKNFKDDFLSQQEVRAILLKSAFT